MNTEFEETLKHLFTVYRERLQRAHELGEYDQCVRTEAQLDMLEYVWLFWMDSQRRGNNLIEISNQLVQTFYPNGEWAGTVPLSKNAKLSELAHKLYTTLKNNGWLK